MPACSSQFAKERRASYGFTPSPDRLSAERNPQTVSRGGSISASRGTRRSRPRRFVPFTCSKSSSTAHLSEKYSSGPIPVQQRSHQIRPASPPSTSAMVRALAGACGCLGRSEEHTSELQSRPHLVCRLLLAKKNEHTGRLSQLIRPELV